MSESIINLNKAIVKVMAEIKGVEKNLDVGKGDNAYEGVADKDVKRIIGPAMVKNGLCIVPVGVEPKTTIEFYDGKNYYGDPVKKQTVFTEIIGKYLLSHESGEWIILTGYGHGVDSQDKSAGKATTYSLKNLLLYTFLVPTGKIDDADTTHSDDLENPPAHKKTFTASKTKNPSSKKKKPVKEQTKMTLGIEKFTSIINMMKQGRTFKELEGYYNLTDELKKAVTKAMEEPA